MSHVQHPAPVALVTGASRGLGAEIALALARHGTHVIAVARTQGALEALDERIRNAGGSVTIAPADLANCASISVLAREIATRFGRLDILVHAAADAPPFTPVRDIDPSAFERLWRLNTNAARALMAEFEAPLTRSGGKARFVCDPNVQGAYRGAYASTKEALRALVLAWKAECPAIDIEVVDPPPMATALRSRGYPGENTAGLADAGTEAGRLVASLVDGEAFRAR